MENLDEQWVKVTAFVKERFKKEPDLQGVLFVLGMREAAILETQGGKNVKRKYTKEQKQDLMNLAFSKVMSEAGYFEVAHLDAEGWPVWKQIKPLPVMNAKEQEVFIKEKIIEYFEEEGLT